MLLRLGVVIAEEVQDAVHGEQLHLASRPCPASIACLAATSGHSTMSPSSPPGSPPTLPGRSSSIGKASTSVGPSLSIHRLLSSVDVVLVDGLDGQLGLRVDPHLVQDVPRHPGMVA